MKKKILVKFTAFIIIIFSVSFVSMQPISAPYSDAEEIASEALLNLGLLVGDENGNLKLQDNISRCEFITLVNRMMVFDMEDINETSVVVTFEDLSPRHWAYSNIITAVKYSILNGYIDNTVRPDNNISYVEAKTVVIRALGYEKTITKKWPDGVIEKSKELGLNKSLDIEEDKLLTRGEAVILIYNALTVDFIGLDSL